MKWVYDEEHGTWNGEDKKDRYDTPITGHRSELCDRLNAVLEQYGYMVAAFSRNNTSFGPTITNNYSITIKPILEGDNV